MNDLFVAGTKRTTAVFGDRLIEDELTEVGSFAGAWEPKNVELKQVWGDFLISKYPSSLSQASPTPAVQKEILIIGELAIGKRPFTQVELLDNEETRVQELIFMIEMSLFPSVARRLHQLFVQAKEENPDNTGIALESLRNFYAFLNLNKDLKPPTICLTPGNNIYALWRSQPNRSFSIHFLPSDEVQFAIFTPNDRHPERTIGISGTTTTDFLKKVIEPHGVIAWISE